MPEMKKDESDERLKTAEIVKLNQDIQHVNLGEKQNYKRVSIATKVPHTVETPMTIGSEIPAPVINESLSEENNDK